ncbi:hypothetical protein PC116_g27889 [Phytophthora cactorum]|nr:hypothetical protein PC116_g27889 [Phytophthora cactorum]
MMLEVISAPRARSVVTLEAAALLGSCAAGRLPVYDPSDTTRCT